MQKFIKNEFINFIILCNKLLNLVIFITKLMININFKY